MRNSKAGGFECRAKPFGGQTGFGDRRLGTAVGPENRKHRTLPLRFGQGSQRSFKSRQPLAVIVDPIYSVSRIGKPINEGIERDAVVVRVRQIVGMESLEIPGADLGDRLSKEVNGDAFVTGAGPACTRILCVEGRWRNTADDQT